VTEGSVQRSHDSVIVLLGQGKDNLCSTVDQRAQKSRNELRKLMKENLSSTKIEKELKKLEDD
jgi:hypothetical protein